MRPRLVSRTYSREGVKNPKLTIAKIDAPAPTLSKTPSKVSSKFSEDSPLSSIIVGNFYEFQPGSICPRTAKGIPEGGQREAKGTPKGTKGAQRTPKGAQRTPKGSPRVPKGVKRASKSAQGRPKALQRSQREKIYTKKLPINRPSGRYVINSHLSY